MISAVLLTIVTLLGALLWKLCSKPNKFPPGPPRWPVLGNLLELRGRPIFESAAALAKRYGDVVGLYMGSYPLIIVSGLAAAKEVGARDELSGRPHSKLSLDLGQGRHWGVILTQGEVWKVQRRFTLRHLRDLGFGKRSMEGLIHEEVRSLLEEVARMAGPEWKQPVELHDVLGTSGINVLWQVMAGKRYPHGDLRLRKLINLVKDLLIVTDAGGGLANNFPWLLWLCPGLTEKNKIVSIRQSIYDFLQEDFDRHKETLDPENPRDFIDMYFIEMEKHRDDPDSSFSERQLQDICKDLFVAGTDTTFNSVTFGLVYMVRFQHVQKLVQEELDRVVGQHRLPAIDDKAQLPYTEATIQEVLRLSSVVPLAVPHAADQHHDVSFRGYVIPKKSRVLVNIAEVHMDPKLWGDPENFRPERFLSKEGKVLRPEALMPFGSGKRQCLGEALARNNMFLFFSSVLQRYSLQVPPGEQPPSIQAFGGFTLAPQPFRAQICPRFDAT